MSFFLKSSNYVLIPFKNNNESLRKYRKLKFNLKKYNSKSLKEFILMRILDCKILLFLQY